MFEQAFKNIDDVLRKEAGCTTELDYTEQTSWLLFLKYLDGLEQDRAMRRGSRARSTPSFSTSPTVGKNGPRPKARTARSTTTRPRPATTCATSSICKLFPYLHGFKQKASGPNTIEYKIGEIFGEIKNKISSGYNLREIIDRIDELRFRSQTEKHELSHLYEAKIRNMGNAGRNGGEYYTPRPLIRAIVRVVRPRIGERVYDGACGSAGFLCESFEYMKGGTHPRGLSRGQRRKKRRQSGDWRSGEARRMARRGLLLGMRARCRNARFVGKEKKSLAYVIAIMNMILHGIEAPNIIHTNTLTENLADIQEKDRFEVVLANPPFGGHGSITHS